jgi:uncharacterized protein (TIGR02996 family)
MNTEADFLNTLAVEPDELRDRFIFADWLEDHDDVRAEFVRITAELDSWVPELSRRCLLQERQAQWLARHARDWLGPIGPFIDNWSLDRGLVRVQMTAAQFAHPTFAERAHELFARCWVRSVRLEEVTAENLLEILRQPHFGLTPVLEIEGAGLDDVAGCALARCPRLAGVRELRLANNSLGNAFLPNLRAGPAGTSLQRLDLRNNQIVGFSSKHVEGLFLDLHGNPIHPFHLELPLTGGRLTNSLGMPFCPIPAGSFLMGSPDDEVSRYPDEGPRRQVTLTRRFYLGTYPVTCEQYLSMGNRAPLADSFRSWVPITGVSFDHAVAFCEDLSSHGDERARGWSYRLPTEAEWEHACRAGTTTAFWWGDTATSHQANFDGHYPHGVQEVGPYLERVSDVGSYAANPFGLYDMHGNVWEWVADWFDPGYYARGVDIDPRGPSGGDKHILRGGSWYHQGRCCRSAYRLENDPGSETCGFRVVLEIN